MPDLNKDNKLELDNTKVLPSEFTIETPDFLELIAKSLHYNVNQIKSILDMITEWATVPFIARYKKETTWNLDEVEIRKIIDLDKKERNLFEAKDKAINNIFELDKLDSQIYNNIKNAKTLKEVEDIYKPYRSKKKTKAFIAIENWFWVIAELIKSNISQKYILENKEFTLLIEKDFTEQEILDWAISIISAEISQSTELRESLRNLLNKLWIIISKLKTEKSLEKLNDKTRSDLYKFDLYSNFVLLVSKVKSYQILALNRWVKLWILNIKIDSSDEILGLIKTRFKSFIKLSKDTTLSDLLTQAYKGGYTALFKSTTNEVLSDLKELGEDSAINTFQVNLWDLLMTRPEYWKTILAIDPWFKSGCKVAVINELWDPILFSKFFLFSKESAKKILINILNNNKIDNIVIWNWTWSNESVELIQEITEASDIEVYIVNESWASVYSASKIAAEEFPDLDTLDRGTVSIARRYIDPISELVKIPVWSIWVWMYQHDIPIKKLEEKLWYVVEDTVNEIWINVNTASVYILHHISWIDKRLARKIYKNRPYSSRESLKKILNTKAYELAIWFLRVPDSLEPLDNTDIHPDQYELARFIIKNMSILSQEEENNLEEFYEKNEEKLKELYNEVNVDTLEFILESYNSLWKEKRVNSAHQKAKSPITIESIKIWDMLEWVVRNVVAFGAFVDIWLKNDGLVHVSEIADRFVKDPNDFVRVWDNVKVRIIKIDLATNKIQLSMKK